MAKKTVKTDLTEPDEAPQTEHELTQAEAVTAIQDALTEALRNFDARLAKAEADIRELKGI